MWTKNCTVIKAILHWSNSKSLSTLSFQETKLWIESKLQSLNWFYKFIPIPDITLYPPLYYIWVWKTQNARYTRWNWATHIFLESATHGGGSAKNRFFFSPLKLPERSLWKRTLFSTQQPFCAVSQIMGRNSIYDAIIIAWYFWP